MGALQEDGIGQSGLGGGEAASDCKRREGEFARSFSPRSVGSPAASVVAAINGGVVLLVSIAFWVPDSPTFVLAAGLLTGDVMGKR